MEDILPEKVYKLSLLTLSQQDQHSIILLYHFTMLLVKARHLARNQGMESQF